MALHPGRDTGIHDELDAGYHSLPVKGMSIKDLDYLHDENSNSIGAMLWHLASTERFYQLNTFANVKWGDWPEKDEKGVGNGDEFGDDGRKKIKR